MRARLAATALCILTGLACAGRVATPVASNPADRPAASPTAPEAPITAAPAPPAPPPAERLDGAPARRPGIEVHAGGGAATRPGVHHTLRQGQTLYSLARTYDIPLSALMSANGITDPTTIPAGTNLFIPGARRPLAYRPAATALHDGGNRADEGAEAVPEAMIASVAGFVPGPAGDSDETGDAPPDADASSPAGAHEVHGDAEADDADRAVRRGTGDRLIWPLHGTITGPYGRRGRRGHHAGIDIDGQRGDAILAAGPGVVVRAGSGGPYGRRVEIDHGDGIVTLYAHADRLLVRTGQTVQAGQPIAQVGRSGNARGTHLHFEVRRDGAAVNPLPYLDDTSLLASHPR